MEFAPVHETCTLCPLLLIRMLLPLDATAPSSKSARCSFATGFVAAVDVRRLMGDCCLPVVHTQGFPELSTPTQSSPAESAGQQDIP